MEQLKIDLTKTDSYYKAELLPEIKDLDAYYYLSIEGQSAPESGSFLNGIEAIYTIAYDIKFLCKAEDNDFVVPKMECYWFIDGGREVQRNFIHTPRDEWRWKIVIRMPDVVESDHFFRAAQNGKRKKAGLTDLERVKFELINEGRCAQILHLGSYEEEAESLDKLMNFIGDNEMTITGYHKEIYLSDPRKTAPEKLKTILRYQVNS